MEIALACIAGLLIGSFLNVCIFRLPRDLSVASPARSFCPGCEVTIAWYDNIPLLSFLLLGGKCRNCHERIPIRYPIVELVTAIAFGYIVAVFGVTLLALKWILFFTIIIDLVATDLEERILPDEFTLGGTVVGLVLAWFVPLEPDVAAVFLAIGGFNPDPRVISLFEAAAGAGFASGMIWFVAWAYEKVRHREGMGFGDVKMMALIGAFLGLKLVLLTLIFATMLSLVLGIGFILISRNKLSTYELPFGSFLGVSAVIISQWGSKIADWYMQLGNQP